MGGIFLYCNHNLHIVRNWLFSSILIFQIKADIQHYNINSYLVFNNDLTYMFAQVYDRFLVEVNACAEQR